MTVFVEVIWHDAFADTTSWIDLDAIDDEPCAVVSVGILLPDRKRDHVVLCQSQNVNEQIDCVLAIPVGMVRSMRVLGSGGLVSVSGLG
jgi:hypothetical protein